MDLNIERDKFKKASRIAGSIYSEHKQSLAEVEKLKNAFEACDNAFNTKNEFLMRRRLSKASAHLLQIDEVVKKICHSITHEGELFSELRNALEQKEEVK